MCISAIASLTLAEVAVRTYLYLNRDILPTACRRDDPVLNHTLVPNSSCRFKTKEWDVNFQVNSLGMRDQEYSRAKPSGVYRILLLGDSFAEGYGVKQAQTYQAILETKLGDRFEVLNAGVQSYSPHLEYLYLQEFGLDLDPDLVLLNLDLTDFSDEQRYQTLSLAPEAGPITAGKSVDQWQRAPLFAKPIPSVTWLPFIPTPIKWWLHDHSRLYDLAIKTIKKKLYPKTFPDQIDFTPKDPHTDALMILRDLDDQQYQQLWQPVADYLLKIKSLLDGRGIPLIIFMHPHGLQISANEWSLGRAKWAFEPNRVYPAKPQDDLRAWSKKHGIDYIDLLPAFIDAKAKSPQNLFFSLDGHFTPAGHQLVSDQLFLYTANL